MSLLCENRERVSLPGRALGYQGMSRDGRSDTKGNVRVKGPDKIVPQGRDSRKFKDPTEAMNSEE